MSCGYFGALMIAMSATCKVDGNEKFIKSSCGLTNGVFFEKLNVIQYDSTGLPSDYFATQRFNCYNPGVDGVQKYWPDKIYFDKQNGHYLWEADTVNIHFRCSYGRREVILTDSTSENKCRLYGYFVFGDSSYTTCPVDFSKETWYYVELFDQRISAIYLFVDDKMKFHIHVVDSGVSPI